MTPALGILQQALAAAEPQPKQNNLIVAPDTGYSWLLRTPSNMGLSVRAFISKVFDVNGHQEPEFHLVRQDDKHVWMDVQGSRTLMDAFRGSDLHIEPTAQVENMLYVPKHGHVQTRYARDLEKLRATPGAVEYPGMVYMRVNRSMFTTTLRILLRADDIPGVRGVRMDRVGNTQDVIVKQLFPASNPRITEKQLPEIAKRVEALKAELQADAKVIREFCQEIEPHKAVRAYKLLD